MSSLATVGSQELLARLHALVCRGNELEAELIAYIGEVDSRRLYLDQACSSMFVYCRDVLRFAEGVAYKRIHVARAARKHPEVLDALRRGELHLSGASLLAPRLTLQNRKELVRSARHRSVDEIKRLLADREPKPDVQALVRRQPRRGIAGATSPHSAVEMDSAARPKGDVRGTALAVHPERSRAELVCASTTTQASRAEWDRDSQAESASESTSESQAGLELAVEPVQRARTEPLGGERYCVRFTADAEFHAQLQELQALMRHQVPDGDVGKILARAAALLLDRVRKRKTGECDSPRKTKASSDSPSRHIPAPIRRDVWKRDGGRCTYVSAAGRRCDTREWLEFDHVRAWARSRTHSVDGITLRCRAHNQARARLDFGASHMARFSGRREGSRTVFGDGTQSASGDSQLDLKSRCREDARPPSQ